MNINANLFYTHYKEEMTLTTLVDKLVLVLYISTTKMLEQLNHRL